MRLVLVGEQPCVCPLAMEVTSRDPVRRSTLLSRLGPLFGVLVKITAAGIVAFCSPTQSLPDKGMLSASAAPEAADISIMAAPGRMERLATTWSHRKAAAGFWRSVAILHRGSS